MVVHGSTIRALVKHIDALPEEKLLDVHIPSCEFKCDIRIDPLLTLNYPQIFFAAIYIEVV